MEPEINQENHPGLVSKCGSTLKFANNIFYLIAVPNTGWPFPAQLSRKRRPRTIGWAAGMFLKWWDLRRSCHIFSFLHLDLSCWKRWVLHCLWGMSPTTHDHSTSGSNEGGSIRHQVLDDSLQERSETCSQEAQSCWSSQLKMFKKVQFILNKIFSQ